MGKKCPHCGAPLPDEAVFCPHCASDIHGRKTVREPYPMRKKALCALLMAVVLVCVAAGAYFGSRPYVPQEFDGGGSGEVFYSIGDTEYQINVAWPNNRNDPAPDIFMSAGREQFCRWPSRLYVSDKATGADAWDEFSRYVASAHVEVVDDPNGTSKLTAAEPEVRDSYSPDAAMVSTLDFYGDCGAPQIVWVLEMTNGDVIRVRQNMNVTLINSYTFDYHDYPMETLSELEALLDRIESETSRFDEVIIYLPPVTYEGKLELNGRSYEFHGCTDGTGRTVFTDNVFVNSKDAYWLNFFYDIDFTGDGSGIALSFAQSGRAVRCNFTGWRTAVLGYGEAWANVMGCSFEGNGVAFHFNSTGESAHDSRYTDNIFTGNGTAVLLENVPTDMEIYFDGSVFTGNGTDIDNRCGHNISTEKAVFE